MSPPQPVAELAHDHGYDLLVPAAPDFYTSENLYMWQDLDGMYHWADAPHRSDACLALGPSFSSDPALPLYAYPPYRHGDLPELVSQDSSYIFHLAQQVRNGPGRPQVQDHRLSIARASDNFLAQGSPFFTDGHSSSRRPSTADYRPYVPHQTTPQHDPRPPSRKRSRESLDETSYHLKEQDDDARPSSAAADACRVSQPHVMVPSQALARISRLGDPSTLDTDSRHDTRERHPCSRPEERCAIPIPKQHTNNKRVHRSSDELVRQETTFQSLPATWPNPDDQATKGSKKPGEQKKQALACLFCRERKIACGRPSAHSPDQTCNQCARRRIKCEYPTESRRGQHKRRRKPMEGEPASQSAARTNSTSSSVSSTSMVTSTILTTNHTPSA